jgi:hypothetical protein
MITETWEIHLLDVVGIRRRRSTNYIAVQNPQHAHCRAEFVV